MNEVLIIVLSIVILWIEKIVFKVSIKEMLQLKNMENKELDEITKKLPSNKEVCQSILKTLNNNSEVKIKEEKESTSCFYMVFNNTIILGNFKVDFIRIQTIAHECLHSVQDKRILWCNYVLSNAYILYFYSTTILTLFRIVGNTNLLLMILLLLSFFQFTVRAYLENDAMIKAKYVAKEYLKDNHLSDEEIIRLEEEYERLNKLGIPYTNFQLLLKNLVRIIIYCIAILI